MRAGFQRVARLRFAGGRRKQAIRDVPRGGQGVVLRHRQEDHAEVGIGSVFERQHRFAGRQGVPPAPFERILRFQKRRIEIQRPVQIEPAEVEDLLEIDLRQVRVLDFRQAVHGAQARFQRLHGRIIHQIDLVQHQRVGEGDLLAAFRAAFQMLRDMLAIHQRDDAVQPQVVLHLVVHEKRLSHRTRIGQAGGFHQNSVEFVAALHQIAENTDQVAAHRAAQATVVHLEDFFLGVDDQGLIDADFAELIFDHGDALAVLFGQNAVEKSGFPGAEKAG